MLLIAAVVIWMRRERYRGLALEGDLLGRLFLAWPSDSATPAVVFFIWLAVSAVVGVGVAAGENRAWFTETYGILITVNYTVLVPAMTAVYMMILTAAREFFDEVERPRLGLKPVRTMDKAWADGIFLVLGIGIGVLALVIQHQAIEAVQRLGLPKFDPWIEGDPSGEGGRLTYAGACYYSLRGLNTTLALGSLAAGLCVCIRFLMFTEVEKPLGFLTQTGQVKPVVRKLALGLVLGAFLSAAILTLHGLSFVFEGMQREAILGRVVPLVDVLFDSTWVFFVFVTFAGGIVVLTCVYFLRRTVDEALAAIELQQVETLGGDPDSVSHLPDVSGVEEAARPEYLLRFSEARAALRAPLEEVRLLPVALGKVTPVLFFVLQAGQIVLPVLIGLFARGKG
ncbi:MAG: hypothetical protein ACYTEZ_16630 [Planctomycetota bacterium]